MTLLEVLPSLNASLNAASAGFLFAGYVAIRKKRTGVHWKLMAAAFTASSLFLIGYLTRVVLFKGMHHYQGPLRPLYLTILATHTVLAIVCLPLILRTIWLSAVKRKYREHRKIARWTFPVWGYVSVTGVIVYMMLYRL